MDIVLYFYLAQFHEDLMSVGTVVKLHLTLSICCIKLSVPCMYLVQLQLLKPIALGVDMLMMKLTKENRHKCVMFA